MSSTEPSSPDERKAEAESSEAKNVEVTRLEALEQLILISEGLWPEDFDEQRKSEWPD
jgi:hypothetical protein